MPCKQAFAETLSDRTLPLKCATWHGACFVEAVADQTRAVLHTSWRAKPG